MTAYAFGEGRVEGENGFRAIMTDVSLDFDHGLQTADEGEKVKVALGEGELKITAKCKNLYVKEGIPEQTVQIFFVTKTSNFGVQRDVTIKLNCCTLQDKTFQAHADKSGNVFTLSMKE